MSKCIKCGSYAFNLYKEDIDQGGLCDVHYWQSRAHRAEALTEQLAPMIRGDIRDGLVDDEPAQQQPAPANLWLYWKVDDKSVVTGPFKTHSKDEAYGLDCIDQTPLTVAAPQPAQREWVGLTKAEVDVWELPDHPTVFEFSQFVEAKLKEKNT